MPDEILGNIPALVQAMRANHARRDIKALQVRAMRNGEAHKFAGHVFSDEWPESVVANMIDTAARDVAGVLAPLPTFRCSAASGLSEVQKRFADKRTKIVQSYIERSDLAFQMQQKGADQYNSFGMLVLCSEPDFEEGAPRITVEDGIGAYPVINRYGRCVRLARVYMRDWQSLCADYPHVRHLEDAYDNALQGGRVEVVKYVDDKRVLVYLPSMGNTPLEAMSNPLGRCYYSIGPRPNLDDHIKGAYDDVLWVQLARHRMGMLAMEGMDKAVRAPLVVTPDVGDIPIGPDAVVTAQGGVNSIGRARLDLPPQVFGYIESLKQEEQLGAMSPEARSGNIDASVVTGRGVQQLMAGFSTQISVAQEVFRSTFRRAIELCFMWDEKLWPEREKEIRGSDAGARYAVKYTPSKDIAGDHTVDISYGFAAGLDPNRATVLLLQLDGASLVSRDYIRRTLPVDINAVEEERKIAIEQSREALVASMAAYAQAIPQVAMGGGDPTTVINQISKFVDLMSKGKSVEEAAAKALAPEAPPQPQAPPEAPPGPMDAGMGGDPAAGPVAGPGGSPAEGGRPALQMLFAGLTPGGGPNLQAGISRQLPARA